MSQPTPDISKRFRYPGVQPFSTEQHDTFFGRDQETAGLYRLLRGEPLVVLHGKSGYGKSSLLNAGIIPLCQDDGVFSPILIRFGAWMEDVQEMPLGASKKMLAYNSDSPTILSQLLPGDDSLWRYAKAWQIKGGGRPLLLFDQFEELFTYPEEAIQAFRQEVAELLAPGIPLRYLRRLEAADAPELSEAEEDILEAPLDARIVFAVRSDRLHLLGQLAGYLPNVLRNLYELRALRPADAEAAIVRPAGLPDAGKRKEFITPPFSWAPEALEKMMAFLQDEEDEGRVEGILLQMVCHYLEERKVKAEGLSRLGAADLGSLDQIVENYYLEKIASLEDEAERHAARRLIEEGLVMEGEMIRLSLHEAQVEKQFGVGAPLLNRLVDSRLLRAEPFMRGGYTYELAHDRLVEPVLKAKQQRLEEEARRAREKEKLARELELAEERRKRRRARRVAALMSLLALLAFIAMITAFLFYRTTQQSLCSELEEKERRYELQKEQYLRDADTFEKAGETINQEAMLREASRIDSDLETIRAELENCD